HGTRGPVPGDVRGALPRSLGRDLPAALLLAARAAAGGGGGRLPGPLVHRLPRLLARLVPGLAARQPLAGPLDRAAAVLAVPPLAPRPRGAPRDRGEPRPPRHGRPAHADRR